MVSEPRRRREAASSEGQLLRRHALARRQGDGPLAPHWRTRQGRAEDLDLIAARRRAPQVRTGGFRKYRIFHPRVPALLAGWQTDPGFADTRRGTASMAASLSPWCRGPRAAGQEF